MAQLPESAKKRALRLLERRDYSRKELILKLTEKGDGTFAACSVTAAGVRDQIPCGVKNIHEHWLTIKRNHFTPTVLPYGQLSHALPPEKERCQNM